MQELDFKEFLEGEEGIELYQFIEQQQLELPAWV